MPSTQPVAYAHRNDLSLQERCRQYRKATKMPQWVLAKVAGVEEHHIRAIELLQEVNDEIKAKVREYLAEAPKPRKVRVAGSRPNNLYLTSKLLTWARIAGMPSDGVEAVKALKDAYDRAKREQGLASIPLIQLEVENALTLATRGRYYSERRRK